MIEERKGPGGRPREGAHVKKEPLNLRTDPELRAAIEAHRQRSDCKSLTRAAEDLIRIGLKAVTPSVEG